MNRTIKIRHRIQSLLLAMALILTLPLFGPSESFGASVFKDVSGHWAETFIARAYNYKFIAGYPDGRFLPDKSVTRAEFVTMVNSAFSINIDYGATGFKDVPYDRWYNKAVAMAEAAAYIASSDDSNTFRPNDPITRQEAAVMLSNILPNYKGGGNLKSYRDYRLIAPWATAALEKMTGRQYFGTYGDGRIHPTDSLTRAQAAKILCDILDNETIVTRRTVIDEDDTKLSERIYTDDVIIDEDLGEGSATIDNCVILGKLYVEGGGSKSITINNSRVASVIMDKDDSPVRLVTKGSTVIPKLTASKKSILQTAGKDGFGILNVTVKKNADVSMKGNFPVVNIEGSTAVVALESGKITKLTVTGAGKYSDITLTGKAQVEEATVNAECYFHGEGVIAQMYVNADNITYETKPKKMTVAAAVDRAEEEGFEDVEVEFDPRSKSDDVDVDTNITVTFASSMKLADGKAITSTNIKDFISLREGSRSGDDVEFTASINSARKIITIDPTNDLNTSTKYYIILEDEALINNAGVKNEGDYAYFTTSSKGGSTSAAFSPANGATGVSASAKITIKFKEDVVKYTDGKDVTPAYLQECIQFKSGGSGGSSVAFTASISSSRTITITPSANLTAGQTYYVAIVANKLKTKSGGKTISASSATWTVAAAAPPQTAATLTNLTLAPHGGANVLTGFSGSTTSYDVTVPFGTNSVDVIAAAAVGTEIRINGIVTNSIMGIPLDPSNITTITVNASAAGMTTRTYSLNVQVAGNTDLSAISINGAAFPPGLSSFNTHVASTAASVDISVTTDDPNAVITIDGQTATHTITRNVSLDADNQIIEFTVTSIRTTKTYTIQITRLFGPG